MGSFGDMLISFFMFVIVFGSVIFLAYVTTRIIGNNSGRAIKGKYINLVETVSLGLDLRLHLVKVGDEFILISASGKSIQLLSKVNINDFSEEDSTKGINSFAFKNIFEKYVQNIKNKENIEENENTEEYKNGTDDNSFRKNLDKLRNITSKKGKLYATGGDENTNENQV